MPVVLQRGPGTLRGGLLELLDPLDPGRVVVVVPTKRKIRHLTRELIRAFPAGVSASFPVHTLESCARAVYRKLPSARRTASGPMMTMLFDRAVQESGPVFRYFTPRGRDGRLFPGTFARVSDVITHLKESGVTPEVLEREAIDAPADERAKLQDVAAVYRSYNGELAAFHAEDAAGIMRALGETAASPPFADTFRLAFPGSSLLLLAGFDEFTAPELAFLKNVCAVDGLSMSVLFDFQHGNASLFGHLEDNYARFLDMGFREVLAPIGARKALFSGVSAPATAEGDWDGGALARKLFHPAPAEQRIDAKGRVTVIRAANRAEEVAAICRLIRSLVADEPGMDLSTIAVAMARPQPYTDLLREQFRRYGIPANITDRYELSRSPLVSTIIGLLLVPLRDFRRDDVLRIASSPYLSFRGDAGSIDAAGLAEVSSRLRIAGGIRQWRGRITGRLRALRNRQDTERDGRGREEEERMLERALAGIEVIRTATAGISEPMSPAAFADAFETMLEHLRVPVRLVAREASAELEHIERDVRAWTKLLDLVRETTAVAAEHEAGDRPLRHTADMLRLALLRERYNVREEFGRGVLVTSIDETRGLPVSVMIVAGLVDGEFPSLYETEVFLSAQRQRIREQRHNWRNRYLFYQAVTSWSERLYLTYPESDGDVDLVRSPFVDAFLSVADADQWEAGRGNPPDRTLWCTDDAIRWYVARGDQAGEPPAVLQPRLDAVRAAAAIERSRTGFHDRPEYEGVFGSSLPPGVADSFSARRESVYSVTQLETYAACPFRFLAEHLLRLRIPEEFREGLSALEMGAMLHDILREFFTGRRARNLPPLAGCPDTVFEEALRDLSVRIEEALEAYALPDPFWDVERENLFGRPGSASGVARSILETERSRTVGTEPAYFEVSFGGTPGSGADPALSVPDPLEFDGVRLRGRIDRVDTAEGFFVVVDYKTGQSLPRNADIENGLSLQLPIYLAAAERLLAARGELTPAAALYYQLLDPVRLRVALADAGFRGRAYTKEEASRRPVAETTEFRRSIESALGFARRAVDGIGSARFPLAHPDLVEQVCTFCPYTMMCRIQSIRHVTPAEPEGV